MSIKQHIPNMLTLGNLLCGVMAIPILIPNHISPADKAPMIAGLMAFAAFLDFFDGLVARALKVDSPLGKQLDSLADAVTFGVLPGLMAFMVIRDNGFWVDFIGDNPELNWLPFALSYIAFLIPLFSVYRLAKFNIDEREGTVFYGLATPANAFFFLSIYWIHANFNQWGVASFPFDQSTLRHVAEANIFSWLAHPFVLAGICMLFSYFLISEIKLIAFKFKGFNWKKEIYKLIFVGLSIILISVLFLRAVPLIILCYFIFSFLDNAKHKDEIPGKN